MQKLSETMNLEQLLELALKENDAAVIKDCEKKITLILNQIKKIESTIFTSKQNSKKSYYC